ANLPEVSGDATLLVQLFQNLIANAIKFNDGDSPQVWIASEPANGSWKISVRDNGIGIDPREAQRVFVIFQRLHRNPRYPGTGIGLAVCKKIVERHHGRIWVESMKGEGATFFLTLPAVTRSVGTRPSSEGPPPPRRPAPSFQ